MNKVIFMYIRLGSLVTLALLASVSFSLNAALTVDRSRLVLNEGDKSIKVNVTNQNAQDPYLAQGWIEDENEKKMSGPLMVLPPIQRIEAGGKALLRIQTIPDIQNLPKDRESVFFFNLREIPPRNTKSNVLTLAIQTRLKVFYRPAAIQVARNADTVPGVEALTLVKKGDDYFIDNPTPYHFSFVELRDGLKGNSVGSFKPLMAGPYAETHLLDSSLTSQTPVLMFINDQGGQRLLPFNCSGNLCKAGKVMIAESKAGYPNV